MLKNAGREALRRGKLLGLGVLLIAAAMLFVLAAMLPRAWTESAVATSWRTPGRRRKKE